MQTVQDGEILVQIPGLWMAFKAMRKTDDTGNDQRKKESENS